MNMPNLKQSFLAAGLSVGVLAIDGAAAELNAQQSMPDGSGGGPVVTVTHPNNKTVDVDCGLLVGVENPRRPSGVALWGTCDYYGQVDYQGNIKLDGSGQPYCTSTDGFAEMSEADQENSLKEAFIITLQHFAVTHRDCTALYDRARGGSGAGDQTCTLQVAADMCREALDLD